MPEVTALWSSLRRWMGSLVAHGPPGSDPVLTRWCWGLQPEPTAGTISTRTETRVDVRSKLFVAILMVKRSRQSANPNRVKALHYFEWTYFQLYIRFKLWPVICISSPDVHGFCAEAKWDEHSASATNLLPSCHRRKAYLFYLRNRYIVAGVILLNKVQLFRERRAPAMTSMVKGRTC